MAQKEIVIDFNDDGTIKMDGVGFVGKECDKHMAEFEQALGKTTNRTNKAEYGKENEKNKVRLKS